MDTVDRAAHFVLEDLLRVTGGEVRGRPPHAPLLGINTDSRTISPGEAFVALPLS